MLSPSHAHSQAGASLIEVLVSIVIASVGLLGMAGMNAASVRYTKMSQYRATSTQLVSEISERMRANNTGLSSYVVVDDFATQGTLPSAPAKTCDVKTTTCSATEMAAADLYQWRQTVRARLPEGSVSVKADAAVANAFDIWISWRDPSLAAADEAPTTGASECNAELSLDATTDASVRCLFFRVQI
jgi:type IV pilus assembly protein PilV